MPLQHTSPLAFAEQGDEVEDHSQARARIRRWYVPNAIYFITAATKDRKPVFAQEANVALLRETMRRVRNHHPFKMHAYAVMPDHLHLLIYVPDTTDISKLMQSIQWNMTRNYREVHHVAGTLHLWQRSFWDHVIRDDLDYERHFNYIHYNPVKHGLALHSGEYPHTSFQEYVKRGWYGPTWAQDAMPPMLEDAEFEP